MTPQIAGGGAACNCFASNQTGLCSASDPTNGDDCECFNKKQDKDQRCQVNKRHKIILNEKDSPHQCSLVIKSATKAESGLYKFHSNYGGLISECRLVVNESPQADHKHAFISLVVVAVVITVVLLTTIVVLVYKHVKARKKANHQTPAPNLDPASAPPIELIPLVNQNHNASPTTMTTL